MKNGILGELLNILFDLLNYRRKRVLFNEQISNWVDVKASVSQGSIMRPLLFLIYINDLPESVITNRKLFADEASLFSIVWDIGAYIRSNNSVFNILRKSTHRCFNYYSYYYNYHNFITLNCIYFTNNIFEFSTITASCLSNYLNFSFQIFFFFLLF